MRQRILGLDIVRSTAILFVLFSHSRFFFLKFYPELDFLSILGYFGVELFFVLSGFLIGRILIRLVLKNWNLKDLIKFWIMRWLRTLPNYYLFLVFYIILYSKLFSLNCFDLKYFFFVQNLFSPHPSFFPEAWSLSVEEWFYFVFPLILFLFTRKESKRSFLLTIICFIVFFNILRIGNALFSNPSWDEGIRKVVIYRLDSIIIGVLFAWIDHYFPNLSRQKIIFLSGCLGIFFCTVFYYLFEKNHNFFSKTLYFLITDLSFASTLPFFSKITDSSNRFRNIFTFISKISYSIYLVNLSFVYIVLKNLLPFSDIKNAFFGLILYWISTFFIATFVYKLYERPIMEYRYKVIHF